MHPPEPIYPCYLPVLGEFNRMTPHEGPSTSLPELGARFESAGGDCGNRSTAGTPARFRPSLYHLPPVSARPSIRSRPFPPAPLSGPVRFRPSLYHLSTRALRTCFRLAHPLWVGGAPVSAWRSCSDGCGLREGVRRRRRVNGRPRRRASVSARGGAVRPLCLGAPVSAWRTRCELAAHPFPRGAPVLMGADCG